MQCKLIGLIAQTYIPLCTHIYSWNKVFFAISRATLAVISTSVLFKNFINEAENKQQVMAMLPCLKSSQPKGLLHISLPLSLPKMSAEIGQKLLLLQFGLFAIQCGPLVSSSLLANEKWPWRRAFSFCPDNRTFLRTIWLIGTREVWPCISGPYISSHWAGINTYASLDRGLLLSF